MMLPGPQQQLTLAEQEEADLQRAMALSQGHELSTNQETGTVAADNHYFGAVRHEHHETKNWIMTTVKSTAREILLNPEAKDRRRAVDAPAYFKPSPTGHRLHGLLTILHAVPAAREALLNRSYVQNDYGYQSDWWDRESIETPQILDRQQNDALSRDEMIKEPQRLMAFLSETERAYGSTEALANLAAPHQDLGDWVLKKFLDAWREAVLQSNPSTPFADIFISRGADVDPGSEPKHEEIELIEPIIANDMAGTGQTLYDVIDKLLWRDWDGSGSKEVYMDRIADVFVLNVTRADETASGVGVQIPAVWYPDRYLQASHPQAKQMLAEKARVREELSRLEQEKSEMMEFRSPNHGGRVFNVQQLLETSREYFEKTAVYVTDNAGTANNTTKYELSEVDKLNETAEELRALAERVAEKVKGMQFMNELLVFSKVH